MPSPEPSQSLIDTPPTAGRRRQGAASSSDADDAGLLTNSAFEDLVTLAEASGGRPCAIDPKEARASLFHLIQYMTSVGRSQDCFSLCKMLEAIEDHILGKPHRKQT